jgi:hypothetical protein
MFWLALLAGAGFAAWSMRQRKDGSSSAPEWPPLDTAPPSTDSTTTAGASSEGPESKGTGSDAPGSDGPAAFTSTAPASTARWVEPDDGECPLSHPIKANDNSGIYHVPGGRFYERTGAERCYANADDAEADGYRAAKS